MFAVLVVLSFLFQQSAQDTSLLHKWSFEASCQNPSASLDGTIHIVFDSATYVVGAIKFDKHTIPFHGRHLGQRLAFRTDKGFNPVIRLDCLLDSTGASLSGTLQSSKVHAIDAHKHAKDFYDVMFQFYAVRP